MKDLIPWRKKSEEMLTPRSEGSSDLLERRMTHLFDDLFEDFGLGFGSNALFRRMERELKETPSLEVSETEDDFCVKAELPGVDEKDIEVSMDGNELTVRGEKKREHEEKSRGYYVSEMSYGAFCRTVQLPEGIDRDNVKAIFRKGVLTLTLPKTMQGKALRKRIDVNAA